MSKNGLEVIATEIFQDIQNNVDWKRLFAGHSATIMAKADQFSALTPDEQKKLTRNFVGVKSEADVSSDEIVIRVRSHVVSIATTDASKTVDFVEGLANNSYQAAKDVGAGDATGAIKDSMRILKDFVKEFKPNTPNDPISFDLDMSFPLREDAAPEDANEGDISSVDVRLQFPVIFYATDNDDDATFNVTVTLDANGKKAALELHDDNGDLGGNYGQPPTAISPVPLATPNGTKNVGNNNIKITKKKWYWLDTGFEMEVLGAPVAPGSNAFHLHVSVTGQTSADTDPRDNATYLVIGPMRFVLKPNH